MSVSEDHEPGAAGTLTVDTSLWPTLVPVPTNRHMSVIGHETSVLLYISDASRSNLSQKIGYLS